MYESLATPSCNATHTRLLLLPLVFGAIISSPTSLCLSLFWYLLNPGLIVAEIRRNATATDKRDTWAARPFALRSWHVYSNATILCPCFMSLLSVYGTSERGAWSWGKVVESEARVCPRRPVTVRRRGWSVGVRTLWYNNLIYGFGRYGGICRERRTHEDVAGWAPHFYSSRATLIT